MAKLKSLGLDSNTVIIYTGDNGTPGSSQESDQGIVSLFDGYYIEGGKGTTKEYGTHVPLIIKWPNVIPRKSVNNDLIDFTDFLPTLAGIANIPVPTTYGKLDGRSFFPQIQGSSGTPRDWIFTHYNSHPDEGDTRTKRWVQNKRYKLYEGDGTFYDIIKDIKERHPIPDSLLNSEQRITKQQFQNVLATMHN